LNHYINQDNHAGRFSIIYFFLCFEGTKNSLALPQGGGSYS